MKIAPIIALTVGMFFGGRGTDALAQHPNQKRPVFTENTASRQDTIPQDSTAYVQGLDPYRMEKNEVYTLKSVRIQYNRASGEIMNMQVQGWKNLETDEPNNGITNVSLSFSTQRQGKIGNYKNNTAIEISEFKYASSKHYIPEAAMEFTLKESGYSNNKEDAIAALATPVANRSYPDLMLPVTQEVKTMTFRSNGTALVEEMVDENGRPYINPQQTANQLMSETAVYGLLLRPGSFRGVETTILDRDNPWNKKNQFTNRLQTPVPNQFGN